MRGISNFVAFLSIWCVGVFAVEQLPSAPLSAVMLWGHVVSMAGFVVADKFFPKEKP